MRRVATISAVASLAGCATLGQPAGHDYAQAALEHFVLNETTVDQAEAVLGPPVSQGSIRGIAKPTATLVAPGSILSITTLKYYFAPNGPGNPPSVHPSKSATLIFVAGRLTGYGLSNTIPREVYPPIDESRLSALHQGQTSRAEAIALLGPPSGQTLSVLGPDTGTTTVEYGWARMNAGQVTLRSIKLHFDRQDRMSSYAVLDNSFPSGQAPLLMPNPQPGPPATPMPQHEMHHPDLERT